MIGPSLTYNTSFNRAKIRGLGHLLKKEDRNVVFPVNEYDQAFFNSRSIKRLSCEKRVKVAMITESPGDFLDLSGFHRFNLFKNSF